MPPAAGVVAHIDNRVPPMKPMVVPATVAPGVMPESFARDAIIAWFRGEFAAANAIIDALCSHLTQLEGAVVGGGGSEYDAVFAAIHRRRLNWIPILQMQKYYSIADVSLELKKVAAKKVKEIEGKDTTLLGHDEQEVEEPMNNNNNNHDEVKNGSSDSSFSTTVQGKEEEEGVLVESNDETSHENVNGDLEAVDEDYGRDDSPDSEITDTGSQGVHPLLDNVDICSHHEDCEARRDQIKLIKGFVAREPVKGHTVNVVRGLKLYEDIFTDTELSKLNDFVNELRVAGRNGELSGETFILYNQQVKGNKRELIQLGVPIFGQIKDETTNNCRKSHNEQVPALLQGVIDHLIQWRLISENRKPNSCIINFFDEEEHSQPFLKPPHLDQPISTLVLAESTMAFGRTLVSDTDGNYKGPLMLTLKKGSLLVMRGNSADTARHAMCSSPNKRVSITFFKVRMDAENNSSVMPPLAGAMTLWQPGIPSSYPIPNGTISGYEPMDVYPKWGIVRAPVVMLAPVRPMVLSPRKMPRGGTGVFLPWTVGSRRPTKHLPPRAQRGRYLALPSPTETQKPETTSDANIIDGKML